MENQSRVAFTQTAALYRKFVEMLSQQEQIVIHNILRVHTSNHYYQTAERIFPDYNFFLISTYLKRHGMPSAAALYMVYCAHQFKMVDMPATVLESCDLKEMAQIKRVGCILGDEFLKGRYLDTIRDLSSKEFLPINQYVKNTVRICMSQFAAMSKDEKEAIIDETGDLVTEFPELMGITTVDKEMPYLIAMIMTDDYMFHDAQIMAYIDTKGFMDMNEVLHDTIMGM